MFETAAFQRKQHAERMVLAFIGDAGGAFLVALAIPIVILAVGAPFALAARFVLSALGLL